VHKVTAAWWLSNTYKCVFRRLWPFHSYSLCKLLVLLGIAASDRILCRERLGTEQLHTEDGFRFILDHSLQFMRDSPANNGTNIRNFSSLADNNHFLSRRCSFLTLSLLKPRPIRYSLCSGQSLKLHPATYKRTYIHTYHPCPCRGGRRGTQGSVEQHLS